MRFRVGDCFVCRTGDAPRTQLAGEGGITTRSLHNAHVLIEKRGKPERIVLKWDELEWYTVEAYWTGFPVHAFTGFAWGYGGEGPNGLASFFELLGLDIPLSEIAGWDKELPSPKTLTVPKGV